MKQQQHRDQITSVNNTTELINRDICTTKQHSQKFVLGAAILRHERLKFEAKSWEWGRFLGGGSKPLPTRQGSWGSAVSSPSGLSRGRNPNCKCILDALKAQKVHSMGAANVFSLAAGKRGHSSWGRCTPCLCHQYCTTLNCQSSVCPELNCRSEQLMSELEMQSVVTLGMQVSSGL